MAEIQRLVYDRSIAKVRVKMLTGIVKRLREWFGLWEDEPRWLWFCRLIFVVSAMSFLISFFGPGILSGGLMAYWLYSDWCLTYVGFPFIVVIVVTFMLAVISGIPTFLYERKRMKVMKSEAERLSTLHGEKRKHLRDGRH